ncbi:hypothetical protein QNH99_06635 [Pantoea allii]|uniref:hypothetical protein n=1 Tax=Pantoea allii TaxID=574096 RepID=UPI0024B76401|nr:hypothetical protein [Pantoea allii]MDJ0087436.1 hypothetical protein [Pantoea allii]
MAQWQQVQGIVRKTRPVRPRWATERHTDAQRWPVSGLSKDTDVAMIIPSPLRRRRGKARAASLSVTRQ